jgi:hypothetical protein
MSLFLQTSKAVVDNLMVTSPLNTLAAVPEKVLHVSQVLLGR